jgi:GTPase
VKRFTQKLDQANSVTYVGKGKLEEIKEYIRSEEEAEREIGMVIFDDELSAKQIRNIEAELKIKILDRTSLILDIFAMRAQTANAKTQVELAQYKYMLPRLQRLWTHLERQGGGSGAGGGKGSVGLRGPGETQLEMDRRIILNRMSLLKDRLAEIDKQKATQRKNRGRLIRVALVGYTNVGKSFHYFRPGCLSQECQLVEVFVRLTLILSFCDKTYQYCGFDLRFGNYKFFHSTLYLIIYMYLYYMCRQI